MIDHSLIEGLMMLELKTKVSGLRYPQNLRVTFQLYAGNENPQPKGAEIMATSSMTKTVFYTNFKTKLDWQLARAESLAG
jgi:hypothetical protein